MTYISPDDSLIVFALLNLGSTRAPRALYCRSPWNTWPPRATGSSWATVLLSSWEAWATWGGWTAWF